MRSVVRRVVPRAWRARWHQTVSRTRRRAEFRRDARRYGRSAVTPGVGADRLTATQLEAQLTKDYHRVEKGLALEAPRRPFGLEVLGRLDEMIPVAERLAPDASHTAAAVSAREALVAWNTTGVIDDQVAPLAPTAGRDGLERPDVFFASRHSIRHFARDEVPTRTVEEAISLAIHSPSVCNRQPWRVRIFRGDGVARVLRHQNGNRGFTTGIPVLALVTVELGYFVGVGERNQAWIEGGIFSSSLVWALHSLGLGTCMLNLSITNARADALRREAHVPASEVPIAMIAIGFPAEGLRVARSPRRSVQHVIVGR